MKVENMVSAQGNKVANQFVITNDNGDRMFQSYRSIIVSIPNVRDMTMGWKILLDADKWNYLTTTSKYLNQFLGETTKEIQAKIDSGEYTLVDLN